MWKRTRTRTRKVVWREKTAASQLGARADQALLNLDHFEAGAQTVNAMAKTPGGGCVRRVQEALGVSWEAGAAEVAHLFPAGIFEAAMEIWR
jgi:hypothetical protein